MAPLSNPLHFCHGSLWYVCRTVTCRHTHMHTSLALDIARARRGPDPPWLLSVLATACAHVISAAPYASMSQIPIDAMGCKSPLIVQVAVVEDVALHDTWNVRHDIDVTLHNGGGDHTCSV